MKRGGRKGETVMDAVEIQLFRHLLDAIPEEMGVALMRSSFSPNIKERLDFSCALTDGAGRMAAQASHIPVHLGSVHVTAGRILERMDPGPGDVVILNDPYLGGTHLPDVTLFARTELGRGFHMGVLCRAHHADLGGATPGSMGRQRDLFGEGLVIPPVKIRAGGRMDEAVLELLLANTRTPRERAGDLMAQIGVVDLGLKRLSEVAREQGPRRLRSAVYELQRHAARATRAMLRELDDGEFSAALHLDGPDSPLIRVTCRKHGARLLVDFEGTDPQVEGPFNANPAITLSAVFYVVRLLVPSELPTNSGCLDPVKVRIPEGSLLRPRRPAAVAMGNVETSQRIVDVLMQALAPCSGGRLPACSQGTMNNLTIGGRLPDGRQWTLYETLGGGAGAGPSGPGESGLQTHMTNTMNTPIEALEAAFPIVVSRYHLRRGSGGAGAFPGGEGLVREITVTERTVVTVVATRRASGAPGVLGGGSGAPGRDRIFKGGRWRPLPASGTVVLEPGEKIRIETPGGGGFGDPGRE